MLRSGNENAMEGQTMDQKTALPIIDLQRCIGCGECVRLCPTQAVALKDQRAAIVQPERCNFCELCERYCPQGAIARYFVIRFAPK